MLSIVADTLLYVLLVDTLVLFMALAISHMMRGERHLYRFIHTKRWVILVLFPWLIVVLWLEKPARKLRRNIWLYKVCRLLFSLGAIALDALGIFMQDHGLAGCSLLVFLWVLFLDLLVRGKWNGGDDDRRDASPPPDDPTPTGDAVDQWLQSQRRQSLADAPFRSFPSR